MMEVYKNMKLIFMLLLVILLITILTVLTVIVITAEDMSQDDVDEILNRRDK